jgi:hypothetical protein
MVINLASRIELSSAHSVHDPFISCNQGMQSRDAIKA